MFQPRNPVSLVIIALIIQPTFVVVCYAQSSWMTLKQSKEVAQLKEDAERTKGNEIRRSSGSQSGDVENLTAADGRPDGAHGSSRDYGQDQQLLEVKEESPYCQYSDGVLTCDFHWSQQDVYVPAIPETSGGHLEEVFIRKVYSLKLERSFCSKIVLHHIANVLTLGDPQKSPCQTVAASLLNVTIDHLQNEVKSLHASSANIGRLILGKTTEDVFITNSNIQLLSLTSGNDRVQLKLQDTYIARVENLEISGKSNIMYKNCSIGDLPQKAITISTTGNVFDIMQLPKEGGMASEGIVLEGGSDLFIGDLTGSVHIKSQLCGMPNPSSPEEDPSILFNHPCLKLGDCRGPGKDRRLPCQDNPTRSDDCSSNSASLFLILLVFSIFLNISQMLFNQPRKFLYSMFQGQPLKSSLHSERESSDGDQDQTHEKRLVHVPLQMHQVPITDSFSAEELRKIESDHSAVPLISIGQPQENCCLQTSEEMEKQGKHRKRSNTIDMVDFAGGTHSCLCSDKNSNIENYPIVEKDPADQSMLTRNSVVRKHLCWTLRQHQQ